MIAIYEGRRHFVLEWSAAGFVLAALSGTTERLTVAPAHPDLILHPSNDDIDMACAFERGEIGAFEYGDGHTYPPGHETTQRAAGHRAADFANPPDA